MAGAIEMIKGMWSSPRPPPAAGVEHGVDQNMELRRLRAKLEEKEDEIQKAKDDYHAVCARAQLLLDNVTEERDEIREEAEAGIKQLSAECGRLGLQLHESQRALQAEEESLKEVRKDLEGFKIGISSSGSTKDELFDEAIKARFEGIFYSLQDIAVTATRGRKLDTSCLSSQAQKWLLKYTASVSNIPKRGLPHVLVGLMIKGMVVRFSPGFCFSTSSHPMIAAAHEFAKHLNATHTDTNQWVQVTRHVLLGMVPEAMAKEENAAVDRMLLDLESLFEKALPDVWNKTVEKDLRKVCADTVQLFTTLSTTKAAFGLKFFPVASHGTPYAFSSKLMQSVSEEEDELEGQPLLVSVFPAMHKYSDEFGNMQDHKTVLCRARMLPCEPDSSFV